MAVLAGTCEVPRRMRVVVALETRLDRTPDGRAWARGWLSYAFWQRYLEVFDEVGVLARVREVAAADPNAQPVAGPQVQMIPIPYYLGPYQYLARSLSVRRSIRAALDPADTVILRVPGTIGTGVHAALRAAGRPYAVEVVGDPYDVFGPGASGTKWRPLLRWWFTRNLRRQCAGAAAAAYVTEHALQRRYPAGPAAYVVGCSDLDLADEAFVSQPHPPPPVHRPVRLVHVGALAHLYKAPDVLIAAVAAASRAGLNLELTMVGDGQQRPALEQLAQQLGIREHIRFAGHLPGGLAVRAVLDEADLFLLPSRQEGLPRALVEAMARGLPCIASTVGGIPELLPPEDLVPPGDVAALAAKMCEVFAGRERLAQMAERNLKRARDYHANILRARRRAFYQAVRDRTQAQGA